MGKEIAVSEFNSFGNDMNVLAPKLKQDARDKFRKPIFDALNENDFSNVLSNLEKVLPEFLAKMGRNEELWAKNFLHDSFEEIGKSAVIAESLIAAAYEEQEFLNIKNEQKKLENKLDEEIILKRKKNLEEIGITEEELEKAELSVEDLDSEFLGSTLYNELIDWKIVDEATKNFVKKLILDNDMNAFKSMAMLIKYVLDRDEEGLQKMNETIKNMHKGSVLYGLGMRPYLQQYLDSDYNIIPNLDMKKTGNIELVIKNLLLFVKNMESSNTIKKMKKAVSS